MIAWVNVYVGAGADVFGSAGVDVHVSADVGVCVYGSASVGVGANYVRMKVVDLLPPV